MGERRVVILCKVPVAGRVKTRLCPPLTLDQAAGVQGALLRHLAGRLPDAIFCHDPADGDLSPWVGAAATMPQGGGDLGDRLVDAAGRLPNQRLLFMGADAPDVPEDALAAVRDDPAELTIAPTDDGGFWCLGTAPGVDLRRLFAGVEWSSGREYGQVMANAADLNLRPAVGQRWRDVDDADDLRALLARLSSTSPLAQDLALLTKDKGPRTKDAP